MADLSKSAHKSFSFEDDLCRFLKSGLVDEVISIIPVGTGFVLFYVKAELPKTIGEKKSTSKGVK